MFGNGMTGAPGSRISDLIVNKKNFFSWLDSLREKFTLIGPVTKGGQTEFGTVSSSHEMDLAYASTMLSPGKVYLYKPRERIFQFSLNKGFHIEESEPETGQRVIVGVHSCDTHAILYLDKTFLGSFRDPLYESRRNSSIIISVNCEAASKNCFCTSMGTGPYLKAEGGYDMVLTDFGSDYLVELKTERALALFDPDDAKKAGPDAFAYKQEKEQSAAMTLKKWIDTSRLDRLLISHPDHPVWRRTAEQACLSCANCVMVCPTCFCYDVFDEISMDRKSVRRIRQWDACQDARFSEVYGGNYRARRSARLRQFVTHKLDQKHQYGVFGTVGCGRCITWCPTGIDLTEMAKEVLKSEPA